MLCLLTKSTTTGNHKENLVRAAAQIEEICAEVTHSATTSFQLVECFYVNRVAESPQNQKEPCLHTQLEIKNSQATVHGRLLLQEQANVTHIMQHAEMLNSKTLHHHHH